MGSWARLCGLRAVCDVLRAFARELKGVHGWMGSLGMGLQTQTFGTRRALRVTSGSHGWLLQLARFAPPTIPYRRARRAVNGFIRHMTSYVQLLPVPCLMGVSSHDQELPGLPRKASQPARSEDCRRNYRRCKAANVKRDSTASDVESPCRATRPGHECPLGHPGRGLEQDRSIGIGTMSGYAALPWIYKVPCTLG